MSMYETGISALQHSSSSRSHDGSCGPQICIAPRVRSTRQRGDVRRGAMMYDTRVAPRGGARPLSPLGTPRSVLTCRLLRGTSAGRYEPLCRSDTFWNLRAPVYPLSHVSPHPFIPGEVLHFQFNPSTPFSGLFPFYNYSCSEENRLQNYLSG
ncbi:hypothetical protein J6590_063252 [Homalodisca vitripennis]|nr:hypothetical protein J6590_063252 [Homalodisca vitripennis]